LAFGLGERRLIVVGELAGGAGIFRDAGVAEIFVEKRRAILLIRCQVLGSGDGRQHQRNQ